MENQDPGLAKMLHEIMAGGEQADLEQRRREHFVNVIAASPDLNTLYNDLQKNATSEIVVTGENKTFFEEALRQVGIIIDQLSSKNAVNNPLLPTTVPGMLKFVESGEMYVSTKYGLCQKVEELLKGLASQETKVDIEI